MYIYDAVAVDRLAHLIVRPDSSVVRARAR